MICIAGIGSLIFSSYLMIDLESAQSVWVDGVKYLKGTEEYKPIINKMRLFFALSSVIAIVIPLTTGVILLKRKRATATG